MNHKIRTATYLLLLFCLTMFFGEAGAQSEATLKGNVIDSVTQKTIPFATVKLLDSTGAIYKTVLTGQDGKIIISYPATPAFILLITATGYQAKSMLVKADAQGNDIDIKTILLAPRIQGLKEVVVTAKAPLIKQATDRIIYNMQADPDSKTKNTLEIMRKMPYLSMDADENILLKGNRNYKIFINGKPSGLMESNPKEVLRSIPAATIQRIEIITTPSSKYDAEGVAGIINIVTVKKMGNGYNGSVNLYQQMPANLGAGASFTTKKGKWGFSGYSGVNYRKPLPATYSNNLVADNFILLQKGQKKTTDKSGYIGFNISIEIDSLNLITAQGSTNISTNSGNDNQAAVLSNTGADTRQYKTANESNTKGNGMDVGINWQIGSRANKSRLVTFSYQYLSYSNKENDLTGFSDEVNFSSPDLKQYNKGTNSEHTFQIDFMQSFKNLGFEAGVKGIFRNNNSSFEYLRYNTVAKIFETDSIGTDKFLSTQNILAAYNNYRFSKKSWSFQAGWRLEQTLINAQFVTTSTGAKQQYLNIIPSISINKELKNKSNINIGFSQRIKRPGINRLNPFVDRSNPNFESRGNPNLQPVINNDLMLSYSISKKAAVNVGIGYSFSDNIDLKVSTFNPVSKITATVFENTGKASRLGIDYNINCPVNKNLSAGINGNVAYFWINGFADNKLIENNMLTYYFALSAGYHFKKDWQVNSNLNLVSQNPSGLQSKSNGLVSLSLSINKSLLNNKLSFSAYINNPFTMFRNNNSTSFGHNFNQTYSMKEYFSAFGLSFNYKFGKLKEDIKKNRSEIRNDDVSN